MALGLGGSPSVLAHSKREEKRVLAILKLYTSVNTIVQCEQSRDCKLAAGRLDLALG